MEMSTSIFTSTIGLDILLMLVYDPLPCMNYFFLIRYRIIGAYYIL